MADFDDAFDNNDDFAANNNGDSSNPDNNANDDAVLDDIDMTAIYEQQRDAVLFMIDCNSTMFNTNQASSSSSSSSSSTSVFRNAIKCARDFYQNKIIASPRDLVGLVLYNSREQNNTFNFANIYTFHPLDFPSATRILELSSLANAGKPGTEDALHFEQYVGFADREKLSLSSKNNNNSNSSSSSVLGGGNNNNNNTTRLSNVLWFAQHTFAAVNALDLGSVVGGRRRKAQAQDGTTNNNNNNVHTSSSNQNSATFAFKRIFIFTDDEDPAKGNEQERKKCLSHMKSLSLSRIGVSVFAHGKNITQEYMNRNENNINNTSSSSSNGGFSTVEQNLFMSISRNANNQPPQTGTITSSVSSAISAKPLLLGGAMAGAPQQNNIKISSSIVSSSSIHNTNKNQTSLPNVSAPSCTFSKDKFWSDVLGAAQKQQTERMGGNNSSGSNNSSTALEGEDASSDKTYDIQVKDYFEDLPKFVEAIRMKLNPKRSLGSLRLLVGPRDDNCPRCVVSLYAPTMPCSKPKLEWIEADTNYAVDSEMDMMSTTHARRAQLNEIIRAIHIGATTTTTTATTATANAGESNIDTGINNSTRTIPFTANETKLVKMLSAPDGAGVTILGFKSGVASLLPQCCKFSLQKCPFIHVHKSYSDSHGRCLFACLWKSMVQKDVFAVAHIVTRNGAAGRLCFLIPSASENQHDYDSIHLVKQNNNNNQEENNNKNQTGNNSLLLPDRIAPPKDQIVEGSGFYVKILPFSEDYRGTEIEKHFLQVAAFDREEIEKRNRLLAEAEAMRRMNNNNNNNNNNMMMMGPNNNNRNNNNNNLEKMKQEVLHEFETGQRQDDKEKLKVMKKFIKANKIRRSDFQLRAIPNPALQQLYDQIQNLAVGDAVLVDDDDDDVEEGDGNDDLLRFDEDENNDDDAEQPKQQVDKNSKKIGRGGLRIKKSCDFTHAQRPWSVDELKQLKVLKDKFKLHQRPLNGGNKNEGDQDVAQYYDPHRHIASQSATSTANKAPVDITAIDFAALHQQSKLQTLTLPYLKAYCKEHGLSADGVKADILKRIAGFLDRNKNNANNNNESNAVQQRESGHRRQRDE